jgi:hypothetical protein
MPQWIPNYGELWRAGETISTAFVESAVNQVLSKRFVKKQQMSWIGLFAKCLNSTTLPQDPFRTL